MNNELIKTFENGAVKIDVTVTADTVWLTQAQIAELYDTSRNNVTMHIKNAFDDGELEPDSVCKEFLHTAPDGKTYQVKHYNLDAIISVGYRVHSPVGIRFRKWATKVLKEVMTTGLYQLPKTYKEALAALLDEVEKNEQQQQIIEAQKPKVEYHDCLVKAGLAVNFRDAAKELGQKERHFIAELINTYRLVYRDVADVIHPYAEYVENAEGTNPYGYFVEKEYHSTNGHTGVRTLITVKGRQYLLGQLQQKQVFTEIVGKLSDSDQQQILALSHFAIAAKKNATTTICRQFGIDPAEIRRFV
jgi:phage antirepressor YoqD-like protein